MLTLHNLLVAFVPQVGNGLCAAPVVGDPLAPAVVLGGQCTQPMNGDDAPWSLARLDKDCVRSDGAPRLDYFDIQYYHAGSAECCGGGNDRCVRSSPKNSPPRIEHVASRRFRIMRSESSRSCLHSRATLLALSASGIWIGEGERRTRFDFAPRVRMVRARALERTIRATRMHSF